MNASNYYDQIVGIIGGTGPEATNYFTSLLVKTRGHVKSDQEHIPFLLFNNPQIPDRSNFIMFNGESPLPEMIHTGNLLKSAGATFLAIPCNTAHAFTDELEKGVGLPVLNMVDLTIDHIRKRYGDRLKIGLLATNGTVSCKTYENSIKKIAPKMSLITPDIKDQTEVMKAIYKIKKYSSDEQSFKLLNNSAHKLVARGAQVIILGCTEIPLALAKEKCDFKRVDPMEILAKKVIEKTLVGKRSWNEFPKSDFPVATNSSSFNLGF